MLFPDAKRAKKPGAAARAAENRRAAEHCFSEARGNKVPGIAGTLRAGYNRVTEFVDHGSMRRDADRQLTHIWFGTGAAVKARAFEVAVERMAAWAN